MMRTVTELPCAVEARDPVWIEMPDGVRLAARVWLPEGAEATPVPAVLEYIPYRRRDLTAHRDSIMHPYVAGHGYACVRVDLRGSGDSDGVLTDEYLPQELDDGAAVLRWLAAQPWCDGRVGMIGISWGGFNGLQIAARHPPELHAVITLCSTDDRYADDVHHMGGCLLGDNLSWASAMFAYNSLPPDPAVVGERWREMWRERLRGSGLWLSTWLRHQRRDAYWRHGSVCEDYGAIRCPVYAVSGWSDGYSNAVFRLLANLQVPRKGLVGPWSHKYPHLGVPGPAIGFLQECVCWWDRWLKGVENDVMEGPMLRAWMQDSVPPTTYYQERPGHWVGEPAWPSPHIEPRRHALARDRILAPGESSEKQALTIQSPLSVGLFAGKWCSYAAGPDLAHDQRQEDGGALTFDSDPLEAELQILGAPVVELALAADRPVAMVAVRLSDVAPDDKATRVTYGLLNLTHRESSEQPTPLEPGRPYPLRIQLNEVAQIFPAGHRLRLSVSTSYWPLAWPPPEPVRLTLHLSQCAVELPVRAPREEDARIPPLAEPEGASPVEITALEPPHYNWRVIRDLARDESVLEVIKDEGVVRFEDIDLELTNRTWERYSSQADAFDSIRGEVYAERSLRRAGWSVRTVTRTVLTSTPAEFHLQADLDAWEGDKRVHAQSWDETIPRDLV
jgi:putative CocE/NonD family hydrolase